MGEQIDGDGRQADRQTGITHPNPVEQQEGRGGECDRTDVTSGHVPWEGLSPPKWAEGPLEVLGDPKELEEQSHRGGPQAGAAPEHQELTGGHRQGWGDVHGVTLQPPFHSPSRGMAG